MSDPRKQRRIWYAVGGVLIVAFLAFGATSFKSNLTPYVSFDEAVQSGKQVQVAGALEEGSTQYVEATEELSFTILDGKGGSLPVLYKGVKPGNFEEATQIVVIGSYADGAFRTDQMLVKCPSKYQGIEDAGESSGASS